MTQQFRTPSEHLASAKNALNEAAGYIDEGMFINHPELHVLHAIAHALTGILQQLTDYSIHANVDVHEMPGR